MRSKQSSSLQKTYDECYRTCSTAIYFEGQVRKHPSLHSAACRRTTLLQAVHADSNSQNNEAEALRSWRNALDQIYYFNAYRMPPNSRPKSEADKALQDSLHEMELQCKERVDLLEALRRSRADSNPDVESSSSRLSVVKNNSAPTSRASLEQGRGTIGEGSVPAFNYPDLSRPAPSSRPALLTTMSSGPDVSRSRTSGQFSGFGLKLPSPPSLPVPQKKVSRTPSPEKKSGLLTTLRAGRDGKRTSQVPKHTGQWREGGIAAAKAASQAWGSISKTTGERFSQGSGDGGAGSIMTTFTRSESYGGSPDESLGRAACRYEGDPAYSHGVSDESLRQASPPANPPLRTGAEERAPRLYGLTFPNLDQNFSGEENVLQPQTIQDLTSLDPPIGPQQGYEEKLSTSKSRNRSPPRQAGIRDSYQYPESTDRLKRLPSTPNTGQPLQVDSANYDYLPIRSRSPRRNSYRMELPEGVPRIKPQHSSSPPRRSRRSRQESGSLSSSNDEGSASYGPNRSNTWRRNPCKKSEDPIVAESPSTPVSLSAESPASPSSPTSPSSKALDGRIERVMKNLPKGVDETAAKQIFNEIVAKGDEVHWSDVAGLDAAKLALKEAVVYPFLRPDLFMGLREPARGVLLFGPPGTGKTMLARAVATESKSTFFSISASSLTSKYLGESEKLVRALFQLAKALAPSIIFVDEIDSLLSSRSGSGEHEATRRIKTEFLIQWSDLQRAAAGREQSAAEKEKGDASRVLVLAATNLPWAIDEAARRRFVRRQYIPLPEGSTRAAQLWNLLGHQKHELSTEDIERLVDLTDGKPLQASAKTLTFLTYSRYRFLRLRHHGACQGCCYGATPESW
jgi:fidgetin-like protein 1